MARRSPSPPGTSTTRSSRSSSSARAGRAGWAASRSAAASAKGWLAPCRGCRSTATRRSRTGNSLISLKGAEVELSRAGGYTRGRLIEVIGREPPARQAAPPEGDRKPTDAAASTSPHEPEATERDEFAVLVLTERSEMERVKVADILRVRPLDPAFTARLGTALDALSSRSTQVDRSLTLFGELRGPITFGYVTETPTWRPTYRVVLDRSGQAAKLQGWALLHNDTEEEWRGIRLELVNGRPDAFLFPLAAPRYRKRELVHPDDALSTVPQLLRQTPDTMWGDQIGDAFGSGGLGLSGVGEGGGGSGEGIGLGSIGTVGHGGMLGSMAQTASGLLAIGNLATVAGSVGAESGALFRYTLTEPLSLSAHGSALVPFLDQPVEATALSWTEESHTGVVRAGVRFVNTTGQTIPAGPVSFFADGGFAGDSAIERLKPLERRFLTFAADLDVAIKVAGRPPSDESKRVVFAQGRLEEHFLRTTERTLDVEVRSPVPRDLYFAMHILSNATVTGADALDFDTSTDRPVAILHLAPQKTVARVLTSVEGREQSFALDALGERAAPEAGRTRVAPRRRAHRAPRRRRPRDRPGGDGPERRRGAGRDRGDREGSAAAERAPEGSRRREGGRG